MQFWTPIPKMNSFYSESEILKVTAIPCSYIFVKKKSNFIFSYVLHVANSRM